ncbi:hypothetical protein [Anoxybacillus flavithermus]|uniref:hypothetical protein n=1 Tax=Anoxybacillus flavithermus TaxID=33934 RepID=UPI0018687F76|nr:hypothetical protein [Anoxybacillus flavithermus]MBE2940429.1 hypothetical protein [Anoxybacillus flavithermus]MBE2943132.1 hypothetical protein [Anoxybacillus flavithermus]MBE2951457.1 hypothetical protein [Anoxybacillus flavithermus]MBE2954025.1 hypothetical protein [Anoxybacillus flavithermus]MBE2959494.1 hypothetical protein [Anoxybacillus flavithermus]
MDDKENGLKNNKRGKSDMLNTKELIQNSSTVSNMNKKKSPVDEALKRFRDENGYEFLDMINNTRIRQKHLLRQLQKRNYDDNDFFDLFENKQGE